MDTNGRPVAGPSLSITVHARNDKSGTYDTFKNLVLSRLNPAVDVSSGSKRYESSDSLSAAVTSDTGAIGFIGLPYINQNRALGISTKCGLITLPTALR